MAFVPLRSVGAGGLVPDQQPYDVELTQFPRGNNVQFFSGRIGKSLGYVEAVSLPEIAAGLSVDFTAESYASQTFTSPSARPTHVNGWFVNGDDSVIIGTENALYRYNGTTTVDVTASAYPNGYSPSPRWQSSQIGLGFLANNGSDIPQYMDPTGSRFANLPNWPAALRSESIRPFQSFLVMTGYVDGATEYPYTVRWSDEFDPTTVPSSWDITSTTNLAGENVVGGRFGRLVDSLPLAGTNVIYAERGSYAMSFIGAPLVFAFRELFDDGGLINRGAVVAFENGHFVVGRDDIYVHDGSSKQSVASKRVKSTFYRDIADARSVFVAYDQRRSEIWICYADKNASNSENANKALVWSVSSNAWTFRDLPEIRSLCEGPAVGLSASSSWDSLDVSWDSWSDLWSDIGAGTLAENTRFFAAGHGDSKLYAMNETFGADGSGFSSFLESTKIDLDQVFQRSTNGVLQIQRILPQMEGAGVVTFKIGSSDSPQGPVVWKTTKSFNVETDYKIDARVTGRYLALRVESSDANGYWTISGLDIDVAEVAER
jgi:hypothetical protein